MSDVYMRLHQKVGLYIEKAICHTGGVAVGPSTSAKDARVVPDRDADVRIKESTSKRRVQVGPVKS